MLAIPASKDDAAPFATYLGDEAVTGSADRLTLLFERSEDSLDEDPFDDEWMSRLAPIRDEILAGDLRPLYLGWLANISDHFKSIDEMEPPIPAGLKTLTKAQRALVSFLRIPEDLLARAAANSKPVKIKPADPAKWVETLSAARLREIVLELLTSTDPTSVQSQLAREAAGKATWPTTPGSRTSVELLGVEQSD